MPLRFSEETLAYAQRTIANPPSPQSPGLRTVIRAATRLVEDTRCEADLDGHIIICDEPPERAGSGAGPAPVSHFLAGFGFCAEVQFARLAALEQLSLDSLKILFRGYVDRRPEAQHDPLARSIEEIRYETRVRSPEAPERIEALVRRAESLCYVLNTLKRGTKIFTRVYHNGILLFEARYDPTTGRS